MPDDLDMPIALRRTRRVCSGSKDQPPTGTAEIAVTNSACPSPTTTGTPGRRLRNKKRVRFSDPGPLGTSLNDDDDRLLSTGLTPMVRRTSLATSSTTKKPRRRHSTPARTSTPSSHGQSHSRSGHGDTGFPPNTTSGEFRLLCLRQVLDGRVQRRIRRDGLSEEMNAIHAEKRARVRATAARIDALVAAVAEKDEEIRRLREETVVYDTERVWDLERQVEALKRELACRSGTAGARQGGDRDCTAVGSSPSYDWTVAARDPFAEDYTMLDVGQHDADDEEFGESTMADLACSTPSRRARNALLTPPATSSPTGLPMTPTSHRPLPPTPQSHHAGVQATMPDPEKQQLEDELASLQLEVCKLTTTLESYKGLTARLSDQLSAFSTEAPASPTGDAGPSSENHQLPSPSADGSLESRLAHLLQSLSDRTAALLDLTTSLSGLGFPGSDASEIVTSLSAAFRAARLELEYLSPGESALPLSAAGAAVLDLCLSRLRGLARRAADADAAVDEYHALELSLRQQLGARVDATDEAAREVAGLQADVARLAGERAEQDAKIADLQVGAERLKTAMAAYARDVKELDALVERLEGELSAASGALETERQTHEQTRSENGSAVMELEGKLAAAVGRTEELLAQIATLETDHAARLATLAGEHRATTAAMEDKHKVSTAALNKSHGAALALRDARVAELRGEIDRVNGALRAAHETVRTLRVENGQLSGRVEGEKRRAKEAVDAVKAELERVMRMSDGLLGTPKKQGGVVVGKIGRARRSSGASSAGSGDEGVVVTPVQGAFLSGDLARKGNGKGKKRRRYDSGLGFLDEDEVDADEVQLL